MPVLLRLVDGDAEFGCGEASTMNVFPADGGSGCEAGEGDRDGFAGGAGVGEGSYQHVAGEAGKGVYVAERGGHFSV